MAAGQGAVRLPDSAKAALVASGIAIAVGGAALFGMVAHTRTPWSTQRVVGLVPLSSLSHVDFVVPAKTPAPSLAARPATLELPKPAEREAGETIALSPLETIDATAVLPSPVEMAALRLKPVERQRPETRVAELTILQPKATVVPTAPAIPDLELVESSAREVRYARSSPPTKVVETRQAEPKRPATKLAEVKRVEPKRVEAKAPPAKIAEARHSEPKQVAAKAAPAKRAEPKLVALKIPEPARVEPKPASAKLADTKRVKARPIGLKLAEVKRLESRPAAAPKPKQAEAARADAKRVAELKAAEAKLAETRRLAEMKVAEARLFDERRAAETRAAETKLAEARRAVELQAVESRIAEAQQAVEMHAAEAKLAETKRAVQTTLAEARRAEAQLEATRHSVETVSSARYACDTCGTVTSVSRAQERGVEVRVHFGTGSSWVFVYPNNPGFTSGDRVRVQAGRLMRM